MTTAFVEGIGDNLAYNCSVICFKEMKQKDASLGEVATNVCSCASTQPHV